MSEIWLVVLLAAPLTYATRFGGYLIIRLFDRIPPRVEAALDAVPVAMLVTLVTPVFVDGGFAERLVIAACGLLALRLQLLPTVVAGSLGIAALRAAGF